MRMELAVPDTFAISDGYWPARPRLTSSTPCAVSLHDVVPETFSLSTSVTRLGNRRASVQLRATGPDQVGAFRRVIGIPRQFDCSTIEAVGITKGDRFEVELKAEGSAEAVESLDAQTKSLLRLPGRFNEPSHPQAKADCMDRSGYRLFVESASEAELAIAIEAAARHELSIYALEGKDYGDILGTPLFGTAMLFDLRDARAAAVLRVQCFVHELRDLVQDNKLINLFGPYELLDLGAVARPWWAKR